MAVPTPPTITTLLTEAFARTGYRSPTAAQLLRAEQEWLEEVKRELATIGRWRVLQDTVVLIPAALTSVYPVPSPLLTVNQIVFYDGDEKGTAQAGTTNTITLASGATSNVAAVEGYKVFLVSGTGAGQANRVVDYNGATKVATVSCAWSTVPTASTGYMIANKVEKEVSGPDFGIPRSGLSQSNVITHWEDWENRIHVYPVPDRSDYALELRGMVDVSLIDNTDARFTTMIREWRTAMMYGVMSRIAEDDDDSENADRWRGRFEDMTQKLLVQDRKKMRRHVGSAMRSPGGMPKARIV